MKGYSTKEIMSGNFKMPTKKEEIMQVYRTLAKSADQRLIRLEKIAGEENFHNATRWAYARAARDIEQWSGPTDKPRFNTKAPRTIKGLRSKIEDIKTFLASETSTKSGMKAIMQKRADKLNEEYGTDFTWEDVGRYFESKWNERMEDKFGSKTKLKAVGAIRKSKESVIKSVEDYKKADIQVDNKMVGAVVDRMLKKYRKDIYKYLKAE